MVKVKKDKKVLTDEEEKIKAEADLIKKRMRLLSIEKNINSFKNEDDMTVINELNKIINNARIFESYTRNHNKK